MEKCSGCLEKQKTIEEKEADLKWYAEVHEPEAIRLATESLRAEVEAFRTWSITSFGTTHPEMTHDPKPTYTELEAQLSRLKEILKGRDEALEKISLGLFSASSHKEEWMKMQAIAKQALSKTWEEGENAV